MEARELEPAGRSAPRPERYPIETGLPQPKPSPFPHLDPGSLGHLLRASRLHRLERGQALYREGEILDSFYWVESGSLKVVRCSDLGKEIVMRFVGPGEFLGALARPLPAPDDARALELSAVRQISLAVLSRSAAAHPALAWDLLELAQKSALAAEAAAAALGLETVARRLSQALLRLTHDQTGWLRFPLSQAELAQFIGSSRETTCMTLNAWKRQGILSLVKGRLRVLDREQLKELR